MNNEIKLLDSSLLGDKGKLKEISYWLKVMNRPNGWHYDLDKIWILNELEDLGVLPGSTIIDAGAGQGDMQYLLAARGYNVISLDFSPRNKPSHSLGIFNIKGEGDVEIEYQHPYMGFISYGVNLRVNFIKRLFKATTIKKIPLIPQRVLSYTISKLFYSFERFTQCHDNYGTITYLRAPFHDIPLESGSVDAVISISAIEHADISLFNQNIKEMQRLLIPSAPLLLTTSATVENDNVYHEKTSGWCYSLSTLKGFFPNCKVQFNTESCIRSILESKKFRNRLDPYYYKDKESFCYKKNITTLPYLPVAIKLFK